MTALEEIKKALEGVGPLKVEFTSDCDEFNAIIAPINDDYDGTFFTVIGCGDKQDKLGGFMAVAVNTVQELVDTIESLQQENKMLREALAPFARKYEAITPNPKSEFHSDELSRHPDQMRDDELALVTVGIGDIRRAVAALASTGGEYHAE